MKLGKFSFGLGDRFAHQGSAQLRALIKAKELGVEITPVWNKSYREHSLIGSVPADTRRAADEAVKACGWAGAHFVDADHINLKNVDFFLDSADFFTIDVADYIGKPAAAENISAFTSGNKRFLGELTLPVLNKKIEITAQLLHGIAEKYLWAIEEAGRIYTHIRERKGGAAFVVEVSMDETASPQTPLELFFILAGLAQQGIPVSTIAPKFTGQFIKGIDYRGDIAQFAREFEEDVAVLKLAQREFDLPEELKLSIHSGSDKFSIYGPINRTLKKFDAGIHVKTAGTTWLEELIGLAEAGGEGLATAKTIYKTAVQRFDELTAPYAAVIHVEKDKLPEPAMVDHWDELAFTSALRHEPRNPQFNVHFRQLLHVAFKVAAEMEDRYLRLLEENEKTIGKNVTENIFDRHIKPLFILQA